MSKILCITAASMAAALTSIGQINIIDSFDGPLSDNFFPVNPAGTDADIAIGTGGGFIEYADSSTAFGNAFLTANLFPVANEDFTTTLGVSNFSGASLTAGQAAYFGIQVNASGDFTQGVRSVVAQFGDSGYFGTGAVDLSNSAFTVGPSGINNISTTVTVDYDASAQELTAIAFNIDTSMNETILTMSTAGFDFGPDNTFDVSIMGLTDGIVLATDSFGMTADNFTLNQVPEPGTYALGIGILVGLFAMRRRAFNQAARGE